MKKFSILFLILCLFILPALSQAESVAFILSAKVGETQSPLTEYAEIIDAASLKFNVAPSDNGFLADLSVRLNDTPVANAILEGAGEALYGKTSLLGDTTYTLPLSVITETLTPVLSASQTAAPSFDHLSAILPEYLDKISVDTFEDDRVAQQYSIRLSKTEVCNLLDAFALDLSEFFAEHPEAASMADIPDAESIKNAFTEIGGRLAEDALYAYVCLDQEGTPLYGKIDLSLVTNNNGVGVLSLYAGLEEDETGSWLLIQGTADNGETPTIPFFTITVTPDTDILSVNMTTGEQDRNNPDNVAASMLASFAMAIETEGSQLNGYADFNLYLGDSGEISEVLYLAGSLTTDQNNPVPTNCLLSIAPAREASPFITISADLVNGDPLSSIATADAVDVMTLTEDDLSGMSNTLTQEGFSALMQAASLVPAIGSLLGM